MLPHPVFTIDSGRGNQNAAVSIRGTRRRLAKEIPCKMAALESSESRSLPPMGHQAQKPEARCQTQCEPGLAAAEGCTGPESRKAGGGEAWWSCPQEEPGIKEQKRVTWGKDEGQGLSSKRGTQLLPRETASRQGQSRRLCPLPNECGTDLAGWI